MEDGICFIGAAGIGARPWTGCFAPQFKSCYREARKRARTRFSMAAVSAGDRVLWAESISQTYDGSRYQFKDITINIPSGAKIALLGANGVGKSTLLHILAGQSASEGGEVRRKKGTSLAMVSQELPDSVNPNETVLDAVFRLAGSHTSSPAVRAALAYADALYDVEALGQSDEKSLASLMSATAAMDREPEAWNIDAYIRNALSKLQLPLERRVKDLSGGQQRRLGLAAALVSKPDVLLLDEPTNHLSLEGIEFLEEALQEPSLSCLCISHDRYFVDVFAHDIWELDGTLHRYGPGYAEFLTQKAERVEREKKEHDNLLRTYKRELAWVRKQPRARGTKAKYRVESFEALEAKLQVKKEVNEVRSLKTVDTRLGGNVISLKNVTLYRGNVLVVKDFTYEFQRGERVGICGGNGVGKSSLLRAILGQIPVQSGKIEVGETVVFGHFDQNGLDLPGDRRVMEYIQEVLSLAGGGNTSQVVTSSPSSTTPGDAFEIKLNKEIEELSYSVVVPTRPVENANPLVRMTPVGLLDQFGFSRSQQHSFINTLSGGERRRLQLLSLLLSNPNCMLLDECSNDIDIRTLSMLEDVLDEFTGVLVLVSHDRFMLDRLVNRLIVLEGDGSVSIVEGRFTDYLAAKRVEEQDAKRSNRFSKASKETESLSQINDVAPRKPAKLSYKERKEYESLEDEIGHKEALHADLKMRLDKEATSAGFSELAKMTEELARLESDIEEKSERWMELAERAENR